MRSNLHDAGPSTNNHDSPHPHPGATIWNVASRFKCHCLFDTSISPSGLIYASFALSPQFSRCLTSVQLLRGAIQSTVPRNIFTILTKPAKQCHLPKKNCANSSRCVFFFFSALGLIYQQQRSLTPGGSATLVPYVPRMHAEICVLCDQCGLRNVSPCVSVAQHKWALKGTRLALLVLSQSLQLASNRKTLAETASVDIAESR